MDIKVNSLTRRSEYRELVLSSGSTTIEEIYEVKEIESLAATFIAEAVLDFCTSEEVIPKLIELGIVSDDMIAQYLSSLDER